MGAHGTSHDGFCARRGSKSDIGDAYSLILSDQHSDEAHLRYPEGSIERKAG